jgi:gas vesicle protein
MNEQKTASAELNPPKAPPSSGSGLQQRAKEAAQAAKKEIETLKSTAREEGSAAVEQIKTAAQSVAVQAHEAGRDFIDEQKENLAQKVDQYTQALRVASEKLRSDEGNMLGGPAQKAADRLERMSGYLREKQLPDVLDDLESYARRKPEVVFGGLFVVGLAAARFFKASRKRPRRGPQTMANASTPQFSAAVPSSARPDALSPSRPASSSSPSPNVPMSSTP